MTFRRFVALLALAAAWWLWRAATRDFSGTFLSPLSLLLAPIIGFLALAVLVFNLRTLGPRQEDSGFARPSERRGVTFAAVVLLLLGALVIALVAKASTFV